MSENVDARLAGLMDACFILMGLVVCDDCRVVPVNDSKRKFATDEYYDDLAYKMYAEGWELGSGDCAVVCPKCLAKHNSKRE